MKRRLDHLREAIISELCVKRWYDVWFFPKSDGVNGWGGTDQVMFIGLNPSSGRFPSRATDLFYRELKRHGFGNAHLTDVFKIRSTPAELKSIRDNATLVGLHREYLSKEIDILKPDLLVALGDDTFKILQSWLGPIRRPRLVKIHHYSWASRYKKHRILSEDMKGIKRLRLTTRSS
jgi:uracil-DNA glycosylase